MSDQPPPFVAQPMPDFLRELEPHEIKTQSELIADHAHPGHQAAVNCAFTTKDSLKLVHMVLKVGLEALLAKEEQAPRPVAAAQSAAQPGPYFM